jgi:hypothetical protein
MDTPTGTPIAVAAHHPDQWIEHTSVENKEAADPSSGVRLKTE